MTKDNNGINHTDGDEHSSLIDSMAPFIDNGKPKLGIFWYDVANQSLFGVEKTDAEMATFVNGRATIAKLHKTYWQKQHHRAVAKGDTRSIFYQEHNYTLIPSGRVFLEEATGHFYVCVGKWIEEGIGGHKIDAEKLHELLEDEFNLPVDFEFVTDYHWDLGHGWSEELM